VSCGCVSGSVLIAETTAEQSSDYKLAMRLEVFTERSADRSPTRVVTCERGSD
jgi:hypothetical protein